MPPLDFRPLQEPPQPAYVQAAKESASFGWLYNGRIIALLIVPTLLIIVLAFLGNSGSHSLTYVLADYGPFLYVAAVGGGGGFIAAWSVRRGVLGRARLLRFADVNHLQLLFDQPGPLQYAGMIFNEGHDRQTPVLMRWHNGTKIEEIGNFRYVTGSGKNQVTHQKGYVRLKLPRRLPNMVLDARSNNLLGVISNLPVGFKSDQKLSLEGNFDSFFTLYAPAEYKTDALYIFTPDVMATMIDYGQDYDMEIVDNELYLYSNKFFDLTDAQELSRLCTIITTIQKEVHDQADGYRDDRVAGAVARNEIAPAGRRLVQRPYYLGTFLFLLAVLIIPHIRAIFHPIVSLILFGILTAYLVAAKFGD